MKVAIVFEAPDELSGANLSPEEFLRAYNERLFGIKIIGIDMPKHYNLAAQEGEKAAILIVDRDDCKILPYRGLDERLVAELEEAVWQLSRRQEEAIAIENIELPDIKPIDIDDSIRREAKDRRQQHKLAVKFSNRRK